MRLGRERRGESPAVRQSKRGHKNSYQYSKANRWYRMPVLFWEGCLMHFLPA